MIQVKTYKTLTIQATQELCVVALSQITFL